MNNELNKILNPSAAILNVVVAYDDVCSGIKAKELCDRVTQQIAPPCETKLSFWSLAALQFPDLAQMAAEEAAHADFVMVVVDGNGDLPPSVKCWFSRWARRAQPHHGAMVALLHGVLKMDQELSPAYDCLKRIAECAGVDFFSEVVASTGEHLDGAIESIHERARMKSPIFDALQWPGNEKTKDDYE
jgi:hypothetical protein